MEHHVEEPSPRAHLAGIAGVSVRQLERLFRAHLAESVSAVYRAIRLVHAERLLRTTSLSATEVAVACGFATPSHFSRAFRICYGRPPSRSRAARGSSHERVVGQLSAMAELPRAGAWLLSTRTPYNISRAQ